VHPVISEARRSLISGVLPTVSMNRRGIHASPPAGAASRLLSRPSANNLADRLSEAHLVISMKRTKLAKDKRLLKCGKYRHSVTHTSLEPALAKLASDRHYDTSGFADP